mmetsp:Transcript_34103/g.69728  ORF Transcript_34103/g.69728 Transcript_34103/m.69728 type:complete len:213 (+) Transcript_34103:261-899(+)
MRSGFWSLTIFKSGAGVTVDKSCGVMNTNWRFLCFRPSSMSWLSATVRLTTSMNTSNSSMTRNGHSRHSPSATSKLSVAYDRSPPDRSFTFSICDCESRLSFCTVMWSSLALWSNVIAPHWPFWLSVSSNLELVILLMDFRNLFHLVRRTLKSLFSSASFFWMSFTPAIFCSYSPFALNARCIASSTLRWPFGSFFSKPSLCSRSLPILALK